VWKVYLQMGNVNYFIYSINYSAYIPLFCTNLTTSYSSYGILTVKQHDRKNFISERLNNEKQS
jgi:hypothetical protein